MVTRWAAYHARGDNGPRIDTLDLNGAVVDSYTFTDIEASGIFGLEQVEPVLVEDFPDEDVERIGINGDLLVQTGGFRYVAEIECENLSLANAGYMNSILNWCRRGGKYYVRFYPHSDITSIYFVSRVRGNVRDMDSKTGPKAFGHSATLKITAVSPLKQIPWPVTRALVCRSRSQWGALSASEKENTQGGRRTLWGAYITAEKNTSLGYATDTSEPLIID